MEKHFKYFMPFGKVEKTDDGCRIVSGYASTPRLDLDGEIVSIKAVQKALPSYMEWRNIRQMHQPIAVGTAKEAHTDDDGLFLTARIVDPACVKLIDEDVLKGFSIGGKKLAKKGNTITEIELVEISVVDRPANPDCAFSVAKAAKTGDASFAKGAVVMGHYGEDQSEEQGDGEVSFLRKALMALLGTTALPAGARLGKTTTFLEDLGGEDDDPGEIEFARLCKREFSDKEREAAAESGEAMPGGGYPIKSVQDLKNAVQAFGRAKNKDATKKHIIRRAKALKATEHLPADWEGSTKEKAAHATTMPKAALLLASDPLFGGGGETDALRLAASPIFGGSGTDDPLALASANPELFGYDVPESLVAFAKDAASANFIKDLGVRERIAKGMGTVGDLACAFSMIRDAQRRLCAEGAVEKDGDDAGMAKKLGDIASELAAVMATKAQHEGSEAQYMTDADDINSWLLREGVFEMSSTNTDLAKRASKKLRQALLGKAAHHLMAAGKHHAAMQKCMGKLAGMHGAFVRKAAAGTLDLTKAEDGFNHGEAMKLISQAHQHAEEAGDHMEMAHEALGKAAGGSEDTDADHDAPGEPNGTVIGDWGGSRVEGVTAEQRTEGEVPWYEADEPYPGTQASEKGVKGGNGMISIREAQLLAENAALKAVAASNSRVPGGAFKGRTIVMPAGSDPTGQGGGDGGNDIAVLMKGIEGVDQNDPESVRLATGKMIGNMLANSRRFGKSVWDPDFKGQAGVRRSN
jgi:hypothetical protein